MLGAKSINNLETTFQIRLERIAENRHSLCDDEVAMGRNVPKCDSSAGFRFAMLDSDRPEQTVDDSVLADAKPACVALVPVVTSAQWSSIPSLQASNSTFVTHLIATAEHVPQTRSLRRASPADARSAYAANQHQVPGAAIRTRQIV
jgi:hypothetical protein